MNLRTQLEGNSFSELIGRNTTGTNATEGRCLRHGRLQVPAGQHHLPGYGGRHCPRRTPAAQTDHRCRLGQRRPDDHRCDENQLLLRKPDGTIQYRAINNVDPSGINGQSVYNGGTSTTANRVIRRQRQRHLLGWRRQRRHRGQRRRRRRTRWRRQRHHHRPGRRGRPQGWSRQRRRSMPVPATTS